VVHRRSGEGRLGVVDGVDDEALVSLGQTRDLPRESGRLAALSGLTDPLLICLSVNLLSHRSRRRSHLSLNQSQIQVLNLSHPKKLLDQNQPPHFEVCDVLGIPAKAVAQNDPEEGKGAGYEDAKEPGEATEEGCRTGFV
jgi:hypothetical protein